MRSAPICHRMLGTTLRGACLTFGPSTPLHICGVLFSVLCLFRRLGWGGGGQPPQLIYTKFKIMSCFLKKGLTDDSDQSNSPKCLQFFMADDQNLPIFTVEVEIVTIWTTFDSTLNVELIQVAVGSHERR